MKIFKKIIYIIETSIRQNTLQSRLDVILPKQKDKSDLVKIKIPIRYFEMIEVLAAYGVKNDEELCKALNWYIRIKENSSYDKR